MNQTDVRAAIAAQRTELAALLAALPPEGWDAPTLCAGWRTREVVAHLTMAFRYSVPRFLLGMVKARGNFHRMADRSARADAAALSAAELTAAVRDNVDHPWKPPGGGFEGALTHDMVHGLDFAVPLGLGWRVDQAALRVVLDGWDASRGAKYFGVDLDGVELRAEDSDWSLGSGRPLYGTGQDLLLVLAGRTLPAGHLRGDPAARFRMQ